MTSLSETLVIPHYCPEAVMVKDHMVDSTLQSLFKPEDTDYE